jgi:hypothetical protein
VGGLLRGYLGAPYGGTIDRIFRGSLSRVLRDDLWELFRDYSGYYLGVIQGAI